MAIWLSEADVRALLSIPELIDAMEEALAAFSSGRVRQPVRTVIQAPGGVFASMPAYVDPLHTAGPPAMGAKLVTVFEGNEHKGLTTHLATIILLDPSTGALLAILDGRFITEVRTAAVSAVAVRYLAREQVNVLAIVGSGVQARSHLEALSRVRKFSEVRCWSRSRAKRATFVSESANYPIRAAESAEAALLDADVVVLATASSTPVVEDAWVKPGACVISVGACFPSQREMDPALVARSRLIVDARSSALKESGDIVQGIREGRFTEQHIAAELGEVVANPKLGRASETETVIFKSLGLAVEDLVAAEFAHRRARQKGKGLEIA
ncbi:MAG TPA: ornithine cyclodeaminase family protein [Bryobacteraceae bacterium]|nr:ornithine cyclodeaminase family protein [Bryobacteraceae bacterium]